MAHEFNNVLTAIAGSAHLAEEAEDAEGRRLALDLLRRAARQGVALSRQLLSLARDPPMNDQVLSVADLLEGSRLMMQAVLPSAIELEVDPIEDVRVRIDPGQFDQLLLNLVLNARDAMPSGGTLRIGVTAEAARIEWTKEALPKVLPCLGQRHRVASNPRYGRACEPFSAPKGARDRLACSRADRAPWRHDPVVASRMGTAITVAVPIASLSVGGNTHKTTPTAVHPPAPPQARAPGAGR